MSQRARSEAESGVREDSGLAPNPIPHPTPVDRIGSLTANELAEVAPAQRGLRSGAFVKRADGSTALDWNTFKAPPPPPAAGHAVQQIDPGFAPERAELHISDFSLQFANPFLGSSLQPPPPKKRPWLKPLLATVAGAVLLGAGYAGAVYHQRSTTEVVRTPAVETAPMRIAPVVENVAAELAKPATTVTAPTATSVGAPTVMTTTTTVRPALETPVPPTSIVEKGAAKVRSEDAKPRRRPNVRGRARGAQKPVAATTAGTTDTVEQSDDVAAAPAPSAPKGAQQLTRAQVQAGIEATRPALVRCAAGAPGEIMASVTISSAGRVTHATVDGAFAGTPQGSCMARALRAAQFPAFTSAQLRVRYPFVF